MTRRIVITGPDGCGKTAVLKQCSSQLQNHGFQTQVLSIWDALSTQEQFRSKREILQYLEKLTGWARIHFLQHGLAILSQLIHEATSDFVLIDGYWYKYFLAEAVHQPKLEINESHFSHFNEIDQVIFLETPLEIISIRKQTFSMYECGGKEQNLAHFVQFQKKLHEKWDHYVEQKCEWLTISGDATPDVIAKRVCHELLRKN